MVSLDSTSVVRYRLLDWKASFIVICYSDIVIWVTVSKGGRIQPAAQGTLLIPAPPGGLPAEPYFFSATVLKNNTVKVETEAEDAALDCSVNSRSSEKHALDSVFTGLQDSSKRKQPGGEGPPDSVPSVKRRRLIPEVRAHRESRNLLIARTVSESLPRFT